VHNHAGIPAQFQCHALLSRAPLNRQPTGALPVKLIIFDTVVFE